MSDVVARVVATQSVQVVRVNVPVAQIVDVKTTEIIPTPSEIGAYSKTEIDAKVTALQSVDNTVIAQVSETSFAFTTPSLRWVIQHNLGKRFPSVKIIDTAGEEIWTDIEAQDANTAIASFAFPTAGIAYVN